MWIWFGNVCGINKSFAKKSLQFFIFFLRFFFYSIKNWKIIFKKCGLQNVNNECWIVNSKKYFLETLMNSRFEGDRFFLQKNTKQHFRKNKLWTTWWNIFCIAPNYVSIFELWLTTITSHFNQNQNRLSLFNFFEEAFFILSNASNNSIHQHFKCINIS